MAMLAAVILTLPSSIHFMTMKWTDHQRPPLAALDRSEISIANYLKTVDPETTVVLHDRPYEPSLMTVVAERRVVLGWARYAVGGDERRRDVDRFFGSMDREPDVALDVLRRYKVTHVIDHPGRDRINRFCPRRLRPVLSFPDVVLYEVPIGQSAPQAVQ